MPRIGPVEARDCFRNSEAPFVHGKMNHFTGRLGIVSHCSLECINAVLQGASQCCASLLSSIMLYAAMTILNEMMYVVFVSSHANFLVSS